VDLRLSVLLRGCFKKEGVQVYDGYDNIMEERTCASRGSA
jgi:hypothetical protein